jgi:hypothetical protein
LLLSIKTVAKTNGSYYHNTEKIHRQVPSAITSSFVCVKGRTPERLLKMESSSTTGFLITDTCEGVEVPANRSTRKGDRRISERYHRPAASPWRSQRPAPAARTLGPGSGANLLTPPQKLCERRTAPREDPGGGGAPGRVPPSGRGHGPEGRGVAPESLKAAREPRASFSVPLPKVLLCGASHAVSAAAPAARWPGPWR